MRLSRSTLIGRALRLRCPKCGEGAMFRGAVQMHERCPSCDWKFERQPGYFLGSIYINYGLTALVVAVAYPMAAFGMDVKPNMLFWGLMAFCVFFPMWFFRYARALWVAFDLAFDPPEEPPSGRM